MSDAWRTLLGAFSAGGCYSLLGSAAPQLQSFPVFSWAGLPGVTAWGWELALSPGYIGQGESACRVSAVSTSASLYRCTVVLVTPPRSLRTQR